MHQHALHFHPNLLLRRPLDLLITAPRLVHGRVLLIDHPVPRAMIVGAAAAVVIVIVTVTVRKSDHLHHAITHQIGAKRIVTMNDATDVDRDRATVNITTHHHHPIAIVIVIVKSIPLHLVIARVILVHARDPRDDDQDRDHAHRNDDKCWKSCQTSVTDHTMTSVEN